MADFADGDYWRAELTADERRAMVRGRLQAATRGRGLTLHVRAGPGPLTFRVAAAPAVVSPTPLQESVGASDGGVQRDEAADTMVRRPGRPGGSADARRPPSIITRCCPAGYARVGERAGAKEGSGGTGGRQRWKLQTLGAEPYQRRRNMVGLMSDVWAELNNRQRACLRALRL